MFPVTYEWRRVVTAVAVAAGLAVLGSSATLPLAVAITVAAVFPIALAPIGFYRPGELEGMRRFVSSRSGRSGRHQREG